jgi:hypothetical protein
MCGVYGTYGIRAEGSERELDPDDVDPKPLILGMS